jgi:hypothetical protein
MANAQTQLAHRFESKANRTLQRTRHERVHLKIRRSIVTCVATRKLERDRSVHVYKHSMLAHNLIEHEHVDKREMYVDIDSGRDDGLIGADHNRHCKRVRRRANQLLLKVHTKVCLADAGIIVGGVGVSSINAKHMQHTSTQQPVDSQWQSSLQLTRSTRQS